MATTAGGGQRSGVVTVGCACTGGTSSLRCRWPWQQPFMTAVMLGPLRTMLYGARRLPGQRPRTTLRGARRLPGQRPRTMLCGARRRVWPVTPSSSRCTRKNSGVRGLTASLASGRGLCSAPWSRSLTQCRWSRCSTTLSRRWWNTWWISSPSLRSPGSRAGHRSTQDHH